MIRTKEWLIKTRKELKLTQKQLAANCGVNLSTIQNIEQGKRLGSSETWEEIENYLREIEFKSIENVDSKDKTKDKKPKEELRLIEDTINRIMNKIGEGKTGEHEEQCMCGGTIHIVVKEGAMLGDSPFISCKCDKCDFFLIT